jgi:3-isopropylmalate/(R)-2-methylmalate dehydratase small subunit
MYVKGKAWTFGRNVNTDLIFPKVWFRPTYEPGEMANHLMVGIDEGFPRKVGRGDIIVGGQNFGCGSSREEAAAAMKEAGVAAVVAPSFGRLFTRNAINVGLPIVTSPRIDEEITQGDEIEIDLAGGTIRNLRSGYEARLPPMAPESLKLIKDGGIANYTRGVLEQRRRAGLTDDERLGKAPMMLAASKMLPVRNAEELIGCPAPGPKVR